MDHLHMYEHGTPGLLITFCGLDGCGKTTMIRRLTAFLQHAGIEPLLTKQPTNAVRQSEIFRTYMDSPEHAQYEYRGLSLLAASDRVQHANKLILPALRQKKIVISDRYFYSCVANLRARGYEKDRWINEISAYIPKPDIAFFLDTPVSAAVARVRRRPEEKNRYIDIPLQYKLHSEYRALCAEAKGVLLSTMEPEDDTFDMILRALQNCLRLRGNTWNDFKTNTEDETYSGKEKINSVNRK